MSFLGCGPSSCVNSSARHSAAELTYSNAVSQGTSNSRARNMVALSLDGAMKMANHRSRHRIALPVMDSWKLLRGTTPCSQKLDSNARRADSRLALAHRSIASFTKFAYEFVSRFVVWAATRNHSRKLLQSRMRPSSRKVSNNHPGHRTCICCSRETEVADVTRHYVRIRAELERAGTPIGNMDVLSKA